MENEDLKGRDFYKADLSEANLYGANLIEADLSFANLYGANLYGAKLCEANLYGANLHKADLSFANLYGVNLIGVDLSTVTLNGAKNIAVFTAGDKNRQCFAVNGDSGVMFKVGCFWGDLEALVERIRADYGEGSSYEKLARIYNDFWA